MYGPYTYKVLCYNSFDEREETECGVLFANDYAEAAGYIEANYRSELISIEHLCALEESKTILIPEDVMEKIENQDYY